LNFIKGTRIELEFVGPNANSIYINNFDPYVNCQGSSVCKDTNESSSVDERDFLSLIGECGTSADKDLSRECLDGPFSQDGYVDAVDVVSWDWMTGLVSNVLNLCFASDIPLVGDVESAPMNSQTNPLPSAMGPLLITGKKRSISDYNKMQDSLYAFDGTSYIAASSTSNGRLNGKLITDNQGVVYQLNTEYGLVRLSEPNDIIIPPNPNGVPFEMEPRYGQNATVYVGLYGSGEQWAGRPVLDVAFAPDFNSSDCEGFVYVVPVVVQPNTMDPNHVYTAAAKLWVSEPNVYQVDTIYDERPGLNDNQYRDALREIEVDQSGNVYVINSDQRNESDILWKFHTDGITITRVDLGDPNTDPYIPGPIGMHVSNGTDTLYLASSQYSSPDPNNSQVYGLSLGDLTPDRTIMVNDMRHISDITEDLGTNELWVSGFNFNDNLPSEIEVPSSNSSPFYEPYLALIPPSAGDGTTVTAYSLENSDPNNDLALPLSIIWTDICGGADFTGNGIVNLQDFAVLASNWLSVCNQDNDWCDGVDLNKLSPVDLLDWRIFADHWLKDCN